jgi:hypothetical protein
MINIKTSVGVALVIFILVFGNIIAFGILGSKNAIDKNIPLNYINNSGNDNSLNNKTKTSTTNNPTPVPKPIVPAPKPKPTPPPVTRAS